MKKLVLSLLVFCCIFKVNAQNCNFTYTTTPGANMVSFSPNQNFSPNIYNFVWDFGDGTTSNVAYPTHAYNIVLPVTVCYQILDSIGNVVCSACDSVGHFNSTGNCFFTAYASTFIPNSYDFDGYPLDSMNTVSWDYGDGTTGSGSSSTHAYASPGNYLVCMHEVDALNNIVCSSCQYVTVSSGVSCQFTYSNTQLNFVSFQAGLNAAGNYSVTWDFGDSTSGTGANATHTYANPGSYMVCVTIGLNGAVVCSSCDWVYVGNNTGTCTVSFFPDSIVPNSFYFNLPPTTGGSQIAWDFGDGTGGTGSFINHVYTSSGVYTVCAIERDSAQNFICQACVTVYAGNGPALCQAAFYSSSLGLNAYFIDVSTPASSATSYSWDFGDGGTSNIRFPQHIYAVPGTYPVCLTITSGNCIDQFCSPIIVDTATNPINTGCQAFFAIVQLAPYQVSVVNLSGGAGVALTYSWDFGDGTTDTNPYPSHSYASTGSYNLCLTVTGPNGCTSTYCDTLNVDSLGNVFRGLTTGFTLTVLPPNQLNGVNEVKALQAFNAYPNPSTSILNISSDVMTDSYRILSIQGAEVLSGKLSGTNNQINLQKIATGAYLLEVTFADGSRNFKSIVKE